MSDTEQLSELFQKAAAIAGRVPEGLREIAFQRALDQLLGAGARGSVDQGRPIRNARGNPRGAATPPATEGAGVAGLIQALNRSELADVLHGRKVLDQALLVLSAAANHDVEELSAAEIAEVLRVKFRESVSPNAVRMALDRAGSYTDRKPRGKSFVYSLMAAGERYLQQVTKPDADAPAIRLQRGGSGARSGRRRKVGSTSSDEQKVARKRPQAKNGRLGPKAALDQLIAEGFLKTPRTLGEIVNHLEQSKTYIYKTTDMTAPLQRLVRTGGLSRTKNGQGQYQYASHQ